MDRRQQKTREAIFRAFISLLSTKHYDKITVGEIIDLANVGRATFYDHFETKDYLLKHLCQDLFCHVFDCATASEHTHKHLFCCNAPDSVFLHLLQHLQNNDNNLLKLLACPNNDLFLAYFKQNMAQLLLSQNATFDFKKPQDVPQDYWINHVATTFVETVKWWIAGDMKQSPQQICNYFTAVL
ncbi:MAG: TetR/AcrR family transcriptional regulator [Clostridia bacterium]|jgi:AcrR family transcriptional regulator|nr:TetR/AcrR family transcriptional regulator [Clostridia bacterium]